MRTWVIFALLSVIIAVAQQGEAAAVREPAIITAIDKAVKKTEALTEKVKDTTEENLHKIKEALEKLESSVKEHLPFGKKPVAETPKKNNVEDAQEETVAARSFSILPVFKIPQINLDEIEEHVQYLEALYEERLEQLKAAIKEHLAFGKKPVAASKPKSPVLAENNEVVEVSSNAEIPKENNGQQVQPETPVAAEDNKVVEVVDNAEIPQENNVEDAQEETVAARSLFSFPEFNFNEFKERLEQLESAIKEHLPFGKKPAAPVQPESPVQPEAPVIAEDNEVVEVSDNAEVPQENNVEDAQEETVAARSLFNLPEFNFNEIKERLEQLESAIKEHLPFGKKPAAPEQPETPVVAEDNETVDVVDDAEIPKENNVENAQEESVAARSLDNAHLH